MSNDNNNNNDNDDNNDGGGSLLRQTLMTVEECFVYKIPPMATSGGHRAEQWDLAKPLQTCGFQVERRDNDLYLLFTTNNHTKLFALSHISQSKSVSTAVQSVIDSSRYFVTQISAGGNNNNNKSAMIGFGFRDRDVAIDLLGTLQGFQKSIEREQLAKEKFQNHASLIPEKLAPDEKIRINIGGGSSKVVKSATKSDTATSNNNSNSTNDGKQPIIMLKKPPKFLSAEERDVRLSMGVMNIQEDHDKYKKDSDSDSDCAVGGKSVAETLDLGFDDDDSKNNIDDLDDMDDLEDDDDFGDFQGAS